MTRAEPGSSVLVSGGAGGLSEAAVRRLDAESLRIVIADRADPFPRRLGEPAGFADAAWFLLTNRYVNGEVMRLDGVQRTGPR